MLKNKAGRPRRDLTEAVIRNAMKHTQSNFQAARYLNVTIETYRKYARLYIDQESGKTLYELHKNNSGKGSRSDDLHCDSPIFEKKGLPHMLTSVGDRCCQRPCRRGQRFPTGLYQARLRAKEP